MNTNGLAKQYAKLAPLERLTLILAAERRGDEIEADRLANSAPTLLYRVPDFQPLGQRLLDLISSYLIYQLNLASTFWHCAGLIRRSSLKEPAAVLREEKILAMVQVTAYNIAIMADGWRVFCKEELHTDGDYLLKDCTVYGSVSMAEKAARAIAPSLEEAQAILKMVGAKDSRLMTEEGVYLGLLEFLDGSGGSD